MVGADPAGDAHARPALGGFERMADQFARPRPVEPHAALGGVHRLGDAKPEIPQIMAKRDGLLPVDRRIEPRVDVGERIGHHMGRRVGDAVEAPGFRPGRKHDRLASDVRLKRARGGREGDGGHGCLRHCRA